MRIHRIRVRNFKAVEDREVRFAAGVTVLEGANETGKTTLVDALDLLLRREIKDSSTARDVTNAKPIQRDVAPEIEAELESGPYRLVVRRRWGRGRQQRMTELEISAPERENLTGDAAHDRLHAILDATLDTALFRALRVVQGAGIHQAALERGGWLGRALDEAAGGAGGRDEHEQLFERVRTRYEEFFTPKTGKPRRELADAERLAEDAQLRLDEAERQLAELNDSIEQHAALGVRIRECEARLPELRAREGESQALVTELEKARLEVDAARQDVQFKRYELRALERELEARSTSRAELARSAEAVAAAENALREATESAARAERDAQSARGELEAARREASDSRSLLDQARADRDLLARRARLRLRETDLQRARELTDRLASAEQLARHRLDDERASAIQDATKAAEIARAALRREGPRVALTALGAVDVDIGDERIELEPGARRDLPVGEGLTVALPGRLAIRITPGTSGDALRDELRTAEQRLRQALDETGLDSAADATRLWPQVQAARREVADLRAQLERLAGELAHDELGVVGSLTAWISGESRALAELQARRAPTAGELPGDASAAEDAVTAAAARVEVAEERLHRSGAHAERGTATLRAAELRAVEARSQHDARRANHDALARELEQHVAERPDDALRSAAGAARDALRHAEVRLAALGGRVDEDLLEQRQMLLQTDRTRRQRAEDLLSELRQDRDRCEGKLDALGGKGLFEQVEARRAEHRARADQHERLARQGAAARVLFETLHRHREAARSAYRRPLREQIVALGRLVHDRSFDVHLDDELRIVQRIDARGPIPFELLSSGAQEQLDLILRAAVARLVAKLDGSAGGVPMIVDDALGYADPERLRTMNALLGQVGQTVQVIVLTCHPDRFAAVPGATLVRIDGPAAGYPPSSSA
ncbi:MAG: AAA family ATPase [Planctomycetes bacterium]|nr:AAA family ATPase [Planctomycetota bacterium]